MLSTKTISDYSSIPKSWIFEYYCKLNVNLKGQDIKIKSVFNPKDSVPSMSIYFDKAVGVYKFKDFSSGYSGSAVDLVMRLYNVSFQEAVNIIQDDYKEYVKTHKVCSIVYEPEDRYKVTKHTTRNWNRLDAEYWTQFNIGSSLLKEYNVKPLENYTMQKEGHPDVVISNSYVYGYFTKDDVLYKIYQPKNLNKKFIKVCKYIQGEDQLINDSKLLIVSSLKDVMSIKSLGLKLDIIAADSENTMLPESKIKEYIEKYKHITVLFDNDTQGIKAMKVYKDKYNFPCILLNLSKDPSDSIRDHGPKKTMYKLVPLLDHSFSIPLHTCQE